MTAQLRLEAQDTTKGFGSAFDRVKVLDVETAFVTLDKSYIESQLSGNERGAYEFSVQLPKEIYLELKRLEFKHPKTGNTVKLSGLQKKTRKVLDDDGVPVLDDEGDELTELSHYQLRTKQNLNHTPKGKAEKTPHTFVKIRENGKLRSWDGEFVGFGSEVSMELSLWFWTTEASGGKEGVSLNIEKIVIKELVEGEGKTADQHEEDSWAEMGGVDVSDIEKPDDGSIEGDTGYPDDSDEDDSDDDIPDGM